MKNLLPSPSHNHVTRLLDQAQLRRLQKIIPLDVGHKRLSLALFAGMTLSTFGLMLPILDPLLSIGDPALLSQSVAACIFFGIIVFSALFHCTIPFVIQSPPKHIAALPITVYQWEWQQVKRLYMIGILLGQGILLGIIAAYFYRNQSVGTIVFSSVLAEMVLCLSMGFGFFVNAIALFHKPLLAILNSSYALQFLLQLALLRSSVGTQFIASATNQPIHLQKVLALSTLTVTVTYCLYRAGVTVARTALAIPVQYAHPRSGRHANPATSRGLPFLPALSPLTKATFRGLRYDLQSGFFALSMLVLAAISVGAAAKLDDPLFTSAIITNNATMVPLGLASWITFARQKVGRTRSSIFTKPVSAKSLILQQALPLALVTTVVSIVCVLLSSRALGVTPLPNELLRLGGLASVVALIGYTCGVVIFPVKSDNLSIILAVLATFGCAGVVLSADQTLRTKSLFVHMIAQIMTSVLLLYCNFAVEKNHQKGLRI